MEIPWVLCVDLLSYDPAELSSRVCLFVADSLGFSMYTIVLSANRDNFISSIPDDMLFILFLP